MATAAGHLTMPCLVWTRVEWSRSLETMQPHMPSLTLVACKAQSETLFWRVARPWSQCMARLWSPNEEAHQNHSNLALTDWPVDWNGITPSSMFLQLLQHILLLHVLWSKGQGIPWHLQCKHWGGWEGIEREGTEIPWQNPGLPGMEGAAVFF